MIAKGSPPGRSRPARRARRSARRPRRSPGSRARCCCCGDVRDRHRRSRSGRPRGRPAPTRARRLGPPRPGADRCSRCWPPGCWRWRCAASRAAMAGLAGGGHRRAGDRDDRDRPTCTTPARWATSTPRPHADPAPGYYLETLGGALLLSRAGGTWLASALRRPSRNAPRAAAPEAARRGDRLGCAARRGRYQR